MVYKKNEEGEEVSGAELEREEGVAEGQTQMNGLLSMESGT